MPVTIKDIAAELGLSVSTVSKALNAYPDIAPETQRLVEETARRMGYQPSAAGYRYALRESGLEPHVVFIPNTIVDTGYQGMLAALDEYADLTAATAVNDATAVGVIRAGRQDASLLMRLRSQAWTTSPERRRTRLRLLPCAFTGTRSVPRVPSV